EQPGAGPALYRDGSPVARGGRGCPRLRRIDARHRGRPGVLVLARRRNNPAGVGGGRGRRPGRGDRPVAAGARRPAGDREHYLPVLLFGPVGRRTSPCRPGRGRAAPVGGGARTGRANVGASVRARAIPASGGGIAGGGPRRRGGVLPPSVGGRPEAGG